MIGIFITWWWWLHQKNNSVKESVGLLEGDTNVNDDFQVVEVYDSWWEMPEDPHNTELGRFQAEVGNDFAKINKKIWKLLVIFLLVLIISEQGWEVRPGGGAAGWLSGRFSRKSKKILALVLMLDVNIVPNPISGKTQPNTWSSPEWVSSLGHLRW